MDTNGTDFCVDSSDNAVCGANDRYYTTASNYFQSCQDGNCSYAQFNVAAGETYLFRFINTSPLSHLNVIFYNHTTSIVAVDANPVVPLQVSSVDIHSGQRVDVLVTMDSQDDQMYWISSKIRSRSGQRQGAAILKYNTYTGSNSVPNVDLDSIVHPDWDDYDYTRDQQNDLQGYFDPPADEDVVHRWVLLTTQERFNLEGSEYFNGDLELFNISNLQSIIGNGSSRPENNCDSYDDSYNLRWAFNRRTFKMPSTPLLLKNTFNPDKFESDIIENNENDVIFFSVESGGVYDMVLQNYPACNGVCETHPIHLHGHSFWVLGNFKGSCCFFFFCLSAKQTVCG